ncbi:MAG: DUF4433 domain-containing protein [Alphaproteobacteria bacterium]|nr:DUF4433 domain-containing protein [Alphaproteobacteria bacterium]
MKLKDGHTAALRIVHIDNLAVYLARGALHAPAHTPDDGLDWRSAHREDVQQRRALKRLPGGLGTLHDFVPFYFGARSPMLLQLHTGRVVGFEGSQADLVYLVTSVQDVVAAGCRFAFSDGHALSGLTRFFTDLDQLDQVDWSATAAQRWSTPDDPDLQRRKQAEFLVYRSLPWPLIRGLAACDAHALSRVEGLLHDTAPAHRPHAAVVSKWYY